jgi:hypothetical protein
MEYPHGTGFLRRSQTKVAGGIKMETAEFVPYLSACFRGEAL